MAYKDKEKRNQHAKEYRLKNKEKLAAYHREKYLKNRHKRVKHSWEQRLRWNYGINAETYEVLLEVQNGVCAICGQGNDQGRRLEVDHDHVTGKVRGLLCGRCNKVLGSCRENPKLLTAMIEYLHKHGGKNEN